MTLRRLVLLGLAIALAAAACNRVVDLTPPADAVHDDAHGGDGVFPDGGASDGGAFDGGAQLDSGAVPDGFTVD